jgi:hypothetical protein
MEQAPETPKHFRFERSEQEDLYRRLFQIGPGPAAFYRDACYLVSLQSLDLSTMTHLAAHLLREIESAIRDVLRPLSTQLLPEEGDDKEKNKACVRAILGALDISESDVVVGTWIRLIDEGQFHGLAHRDGLNGPRPCNQAFDTFFRDVESIFMAVLRRYEVKFLKMCDFVDKIVLCQHPPKGLKKKIPANHISYRYLFSKVSNPEWLLSLQKQGFFDDPPQLVKGDDGHVRVAHEWPQIIYLQKMAKESSREIQAQVLNIMLAAETNYYFIHQEFTEGVLSMPADLAARWAEYEIAWIRQENQVEGILAEHLGRLVSKLAKEGDVRTGLRLLAEVLEIQSDPEAEQKRAKRKTDEMAFDSPQPQIRCDRYQFEAVLKSAIPDVLQVKPFETLELLCRLIEKATVCSLMDDGEHKPEDSSHIIRSAIENHEQNYGFNLQDPLITVLRDAAEKVCREQPQKISNVIALLEQHEWNVFRRIGLHLLRVIPDSPLNLIDKYLTDNTLFDEPAFRHEYFHLTQERFGKLPPDAQNTILKWIDGGLSIWDYIRKQDDQSEDQKNKHFRYWQYEKLTPIHAYLPEEWKPRFLALKNEFGDPEHPDFGSYSTSWNGGPESPKSVDELSAMSITDLIGFLKTWKPTGRWRDPTPNSLGLALRDVVTNAPERFAESINLFMNASINPTYIRNVVTGFCQAVEKGKLVLYPALFKLCRWVLDQPVEITNHDLPGGLRDGLEVDLSRTQTRQEIARLCGKIFKDEANLPFDLREDAWKLIQPLTDDPEPDLEYEAKYDKGWSDVFTLSLNTIRGEALHGMMHYAMWVCRQIQKAEKGRKPSLNDLPEVREVLEFHLDPKNDPTRTTRSVFGEWLPQLIFLDENWVRQNLDNLFPSAPQLRPLREAALGSYLVYSKPYKSAFRVLKDIFHKEVDALANWKPDNDEDVSPQIQLSDYLMVFYAWGEADTELGGIIEAFFRIAPAKLTAEALEFIGRDLAQKDPSDPVIERFKKLWDWRIEIAGGIDKVPKEDLSTFGCWFASGKCGEAWAFSHLEKVLQRTDIGRPKNFVFEHMADIFEKYPAESLRCLRLFIDRNQTPWFFGHKEKGVWNILEAGLAMDDPAIRDAAEEIVHLLGSKGYLPYRELLQKKA